MIQRTQPRRCARFEAPPRRPARLRPAGSHTDTRNAPTRTQPHARTNANPTCRIALRWSTRWRRSCQASSRPPRGRPKCGSPRPSTGAPRWGQGRDCPGLPSPIPVYCGRVGRQRGTHSFKSCPALLTASPPHNPKRRGRRTVEVGCGSGYVICSAALALRQAAQQARAAGTPGGHGSGGGCGSLWAVDINAAALAATAQTLAAHQVRARDGASTILVPPSGPGGFALACALLPDVSSAFWGRRPSVAKGRKRARCRAARRSGAWSWCSATCWARCAAGCAAASTCWWGPAARSC